jgi:hypothetical protein
VRTSPPSGHQPGLDPKGFFMSDLIPFSFESHEVRVIADEHGDPILVAKDVAEALDYTWNGTVQKNGGG